MYNKKAKLEITFQSPGIYNLHFGRSSDLLVRWCVLPELFILFVILLSREFLKMFSGNSIAHGF